MKAVPRGLWGRYVCTRDGRSWYWKEILLNAKDGAFVNNAVEMSNISEKYHRRIATCSTP